MHLLFRTLPMQVVPTQQDEDKNETFGGIPRPGKKYCTIARIKSLLTLYIGRGADNRSLGGPREHEMCSAGTQVSSLLCMLYLTCMIGLTLFSLVVQQTCSRVFSSAYVCGLVYLCQQVCLFVDHLLFSFPC